MDNPKGYLMEPVRSLWNYPKLAMWDQALKLKCKWRHLVKCNDFPMFQDSMRWMENVV